MFDLIAGYRDLIYLGAWTGLGAGGVLACGAIAYFGATIAPVRKAAIIGGLCFASAWAGGMHMGNVERRAVLAEWDTAKVKAAADSKARDENAAAETKRTFDPIARQLEQADATRQQQVTHVPDSDDRCRIGPSALRMRPAKPK